MHLVDYVALVAVWLLAIALALVAGFAVARGGICAVAGVRQIIETRRAHIFLSFLECSTWALLALILANAVGLMSIAGWPSRILVAGALIGGVLFGLGALLNGACAFGTIARLGSGDFSFLALVPGFVLGAWCLHLTGMFGGPPASTPSHIASGVLAPTLVALGAFALWRLWAAARFASVRGQVKRLATGAWPPALSVALIALVNVGLLIIIFSWPYTSLLADLASGRGADLLGRALLALALFVGALAGAASGGMYRSRPLTTAEAARHFGGGVLMGAGAAMIPGGNDSLVLVGLPLLQPAAAAAYVAMVSAIAVGLLLRRLSAKQQPART